MSLLIMCIDKQYIQQILQGVAVVCIAPNTELYSHFKESSLFILILTTRLFAGA